MVRRAAAQILVAPVVVQDLPAVPAMNPLVAKMMDAILATEGYNSWEQWIRVSPVKYPGSQTSEGLAQLEYDDGEGGFYCHATLIVYADKIVLDGCEEYHPMYAADIHPMVENIMELVFLHHRLAHVEYP
jgi:hypothetical protein